MTVIFYIRFFLYVTLVSVMVSVNKERQKRGIYAWRFGSIFVVLDILSMFFYSEPLGNRMFSALLLLQCFLFMPLLSQISTCNHCGRRTYWSEIVSNKCPHCGEMYFFTKKRSLQRRPSMINKTTVTLYHIASLLFYITAIIEFFNTGFSSSGVVWFCLGSTFLCLGSRTQSKNKRSDDEDTFDKK